MSMETFKKKIIKISNPIDMTSLEIYFTLIRYLQVDGVIIPTTKCICAYIYKVTCMEHSNQKSQTMAILILLVTIVSCVLARPSSKNVEPVEITVYYETLCPKCENFFPKQLLPLYTDTDYDFASLISKIELVPYGQVAPLNMSKWLDIWCQHGRSECDGNKLHACAIKYIPDTLTTLNYISCLANETLSKHFEMLEHKYPIDKCQNELPAGIYQKIINCYKSDEGWELFDDNAEKTHQFEKRFFPYVTFNGKRDDDVAKDAVENLKKTFIKVTGIDKDSSF
ncbi:unnamed protein product [Nezara viridula]|uniref:Uncharacterized protein n=1 Tax=Nezara viridula TaxID=85310 RepID=A0A9P0H0A7_NEZVI|nr:unnamed protein product [Nezara viridula]